MANTKLIQLLDAMTDSSVFGAEADALNVKFKKVLSISQLIATKIDAPELMLNELKASIVTQQMRRSSGKLVKVISSIPAIAVQDDFI